MQGETRAIGDAVVRRTNGSRQVKLGIRDKPLSFGSCISYTQHGTFYASGVVAS
jgi:hypothetical protein